MTDWKECKHEWEIRDGYDLGDVPGSGPREEVICPKCGCPGERTVKTGEVYWPTT